MRAERELELRKAGDDASGASRVDGAVGTATPHDSAVLHVNGRAAYTDDIPEPRGLLHAAFGVSTQAHARIRGIDLSRVEAAPGVVAVITASDVPGPNNYGAIIADDPILAEDEVVYAGQPVFAVAATTVDAARRAARLANIDYEPLEAILDPETALERESFVLPSTQLARGDADTAIANARHRLTGTARVGGQDQFYLEGQISIAIPREGGDLFLYSSTQHPGEIQHAVAKALGLQQKDVTVECRRMGGAFGGKESQPALIACTAAILAQRTGRPVKLRLDRDADMIITGKRHDFVSQYEVGFDDTGRILGIRYNHASRCGASADLSGAVNDRAMFHSDNAYFLEHVAIDSHRCKTHTVSNTAFRGFGGPQGMFACEQVIDDIARHLGRDPLDVRRVNFYGTDSRNVTPYGQVIEDNIIAEIVDQLETSADYRDRRREIEAWNANSPILKRGIALTPVKFGISFTATHLNQAGALVNVYTDGTVQLNHGGTEMGQGLFVKVAQVVAETLQIDLSRIRCTASDTSKVPNASATAASAGSDLNGMAARNAAEKIKRRLTGFAAEHYGCDEHEVRFDNNHVHVGDQTLTFAELVHAAYMARVSLSAQGFYKTPKIDYDKTTLTGRPFYYFAYGAACTEVVIDTLTGENRMTRVDILHDCGRSLNPAVDLGQVEGGFIQGAGWLTTEELWWNPRGDLMTHAPATYKIPCASDLPPDFRVTLLESSENREDTIYKSKAVGEPPLMLGLSVFHAIRDAVAACSADPTRAPELEAPATPEHVLDAVMLARGDTRV
ncbi:MAG: xanthine dehydrogenase molybdopterin binding subunit [Pseudomonadota bacterium]